MLTRPEVAVALARRAVDLARDVRMPSQEAAGHLTRLAMGRADALTEAVQELGAMELRPVDAECARRLLLQAISVTGRR
jgi:hypothetical protein